MSRSPSVQITTRGSFESPLTLVACFEAGTPQAQRLPDSVHKAGRGAVRRSGWKAEKGRIARAPIDGGPRILAVQGQGDEKKFDVGALTSWAVSAVRSAGREGLDEILLVLPDTEAARGGGAMRLVLDLLLSGYRFDRFRKAETVRQVRRVRIVPPPGEDARYRKALIRARAVSAGAILARDLGNTPPNEASPAWMASRARSLARKFGMKVRVLGVKELEKLRMGGILAVGRGSRNPPRLVRLEWGGGPETISLVGKGVTFDTGGISLKPPAAMGEMKYDKCGACGVLGIARATAEMDLPFRFKAYLPLAENMPDGLAYRPGDIVRCYNGKTVEVLNTDAEGRMILADALAWAAKEKPDAMLEYSTLTGASVVALGHHGAALYTPDDLLADELSSAGLASGERVWRMPLWPEFRSELKATHADLKNVAGRWGGANHAAAFLAHFMGDVESWAHLDIAGPAYVGADQAGDKGATGYGVALTVQWLMDRAGIA